MYLHCSVDESCGHGKHLRTYYSWISMFIFNPYFCCFVSNKTFRCKCKSFRLIWILIPTLRTYSYHFFSFHCEIKWSSNIVMNKTHLMLDLIHSYIFVHILCWFTMLLWHLALCCGSSVGVSSFQLNVWKTYVCVYFTGHSFEET